MCFYLVTRRPRRTRWAATRTPTAPRVRHTSLDPLESSRRQCWLTRHCRSAPCSMPRVARAGGQTIERGRETAGGREAGHRALAPRSLARRSRGSGATCALAHARARSRCSTVVASPAGRGAAAEGWTGERQCGSRTDRAGAGGCGGGAPRPHGTNNFQQNPSPPTLLAADLLAAQRGPVPGEGCGRDSSRGQLSTKFDAA